MIEIKDLLGKFDNLLLSEEAKISFIKKTISEILKTEVAFKDIKIRNNIIYLNIKPIYKNEIFIKQNQIFLKLKELFLGKNPPEIR